MDTRLASSPNNLDFSTKATARAVLKDTLQHPLTLYSSAVGMLGGVAMAMFDVSLITSGLALGGFGVAAGAWAINYFLRGESFVSRHIGKMQAELEAHKSALSRHLAEELGKMKPVRGAEDLAEQAQRQFPMIKEKFEAFESLLRDKLAPSEITYARYLGTAEQIYLSVLDNLVQLVAGFKSITTIDRDYVEERLKIVRSLKQPQPADVEEEATLLKRLKLLDQSIDKINTLVTRNEEAMTALTLAATAVAEMKTIKGRATTALPTAIKELEELAQRASQYSIER